MKNYYSSMKLESGVKIFVVGKAGSNDAMSSSLLYQSFNIDICIFFISHFDADICTCSISIMDDCARADVAYLSSLGPSFMDEAALGWSTRCVGPETSPGD